MSQLQHDIAMVLTQALCFGIFLWILSKYAVGPVNKILEERREKIKSEFDRIDEMEQKYKKLHDEYEEKLSHFDEEAREKMQEVISDGRKTSAEITENARQEAKQILEHSKRNVQLEIDKAKIEMKDQIIRMTMAATEKLIHEKLDPAKDKKLISEFISTLEGSSSKSAGGGSDQV